MAVRRFSWVGMVGVAGAAQQDQFASVDAGQCLRC
jgi:hypothetical protein